MDVVVFMLNTIGNQKLNKSEYTWVIKQELEGLTYKNLAEKYADIIADKIIEYEVQEKLEYDTCKAVSILNKWAIRGMIMGQIKEKYNTTRWYAYIGNLNFHSILYPRHMYSRYKYKWMWRFDCKYGYSIFRYTGLNWILTKWQIFCYKSAYREVEKKYPNVKNCIDHRELLTK